MDVKSAEPNANCGALFTSTSAGKKAGIDSELQRCGRTTHDFNSFFLRNRKCIKEQKNGNIYALGESFFLLLLCTIEECAIMYQVMVQDLII